MTNPIHKNKIRIRNGATMDSTDHNLKASASAKKLALASDEVDVGARTGVSAVGGAFFGGAVGNAIGGPIGTVVGAAVGGLACGAVTLYATKRANRTN